MKAVVCTKYGPPEVLEIKEIKTPVPRDNEVRIKIYATTVTAADFRIRSFTMPPFFWLPGRLMLGLTKPRKPILGVEVSGEIDMVGKGVRLFRKGDHVFAATLSNFGGYAEYVCLPEHAPIAMKPSNITHEEAAAIPIGACTALHYLRRGGLVRGQKVLVYGASGSVGTYAVQLAKYFGTEVTAVCSGANLALVKSLGADKAIDYTTTDFSSKLGKYDVVFLAVDKCPFSLCMDVLMEKGVYLNVTAPLKSLPMVWVSLTTGKRIIVGENVPEKADDLVFLKRLVEEGVLKPIIDRRYRLGHIVEAHRYVDKGHKKGNVVITI